MSNSIKEASMSMRKSENFDETNVDEKLKE